MLLLEDPDLPVDKMSYSRTVRGCKVIKLYRRESKVSRLDDILAKKHHLLKNGELICSREFLQALKEKPVIRRVQSNWYAYHFSEKQARAARAPRTSPGLASTRQEPDPLDEPCES
jgi:hypothetical protein